MRKFYGRDKEHGEPAKVLFGRNLLIEGLEKGMMGMEEGERRTIEVKPEEGYGEGANPRWTDNRSKSGGF